jgi:hypothetical protein
MTSVVEDPCRAGSVASALSPGLGSRLNAISRDLAAVLADLDPALLSGRDACAVYLSFAGMERLAVGAKAILAPRIEVSGIWKEDGHRSAPSMLAALEGVSARQARNTLEVGQRLGQLPATKDAVRRGTLSGPKVTQLTGALVLIPTGNRNCCAERLMSPSLSSRTGVSSRGPRRHGRTPSPR